MSIDEVLASPNASKIIVGANIDFAADCKPAELESTTKMLVALYKNEKVTQSDIDAAMTDMVEFIDSFACDNPRIYEYVGDLFCAFINMGALTIKWLCDVTSRVSDASCKPKVIEGAMNSIKKAYGDSAPRSILKDAGERSALEGLLGPVKFGELERQFA